MCGGGRWPVTGTTAARGDAVPTNYYADLFSRPTREFWSKIISTSERGTAYGRSTSAQTAKFS